MIQSKVKIIGLTGGIGTGKSTVSKIIKDKGFPVVDADLIAREVVDTGKPAYLKIVESFGKQILNQDRSIDRKKLGSIVFSDEDSRILLNRIVHPYISEKIIEEIKKYSKIHNVIFLDIPLLIEEMKNLNESGLTFNEVWVVYADEKTQIDRIIERDKTDLENANIRIGSQMPIEEKLKYGDVIIDNTRDIHQLFSNVNKALETFY